LNDKKTPAKITRREMIILSLIILLAIGIRIGITINTLHVPIYTGEAVYIGEAARNLADGRGYVVDPVYAGQVNTLQAEKNKLVDLQDVTPPSDESFVPYYALPPGPSALLALMYDIFGKHRYIYLRIFEAIISSFGCLLIFLMCRELLNNKIGLIAAFLYAVYLPMAYVSTWALQDALIPLFTLAAAYLFFQGAQKKSWLYYLYAGLVTGAGAYFQPTIMLLPLGLGLGLFIYRLGDLKFLKSLGYAALSTAIAVVMVVLAVTPWVVRDYKITGDIVPMRPGSWQGIWEGFGEYSNPVGAVLNDAATNDQLKQEGYNVASGTPEFDAVLKNKSIKAITDHPIWWLGLLARRTPHTIVYWTDLGIATVPQDAQGKILQGTAGDSYSQLISAAKSLNFSEAWSIFIAHPYDGFVFGLTLCFAVLPVVFSIIGIWFARRKWKVLVLVAAAPFYYSVVNIMFFVNWKTLVPGAFGYIIFSAIALYYLALKVKIFHEERGMS
jgi:4-amino-4-deoxy-L-arabinose transferase-like glycosyltransferase